MKHKSEEVFPKELIELLDEYQKNKIKNLLIERKMKNYLGIEDTANQNVINAENYYKKD